MEREKKSDLRLSSPLGKRTKSKVLLSPEGEIPEKGSLGGLSVCWADVREKSEIGQRRFKKSLLSGREGRGVPQPTIIRGKATDFRERGAKSAFLLGRKGGESAPNCFPRKDHTCFVY